MQFYYRIYQKTKVLTRKRKKKRTKTGSRNQPARKKRHMDSSWAGADASKETRVEVDKEHPSPTISAKLEKSGKEKSNTKLRITVSKDSVNSEKKSKSISPSSAKATKKVSPPTTQPPNSAKKPQKLESRGSVAVNNPVSQPPPTKTIPSRKEVPAVTTVTGQGTNPISPVQTSKKSSSSPSLHTKSMQVPAVTPVKSLPKSQNTKSNNKVPKERTNLNSKPVVPKPPTVKSKVDVSAKKPEKPVVPKLANSDKSPHKLVIAEKPSAGGEKEVVEISVEVSASDVKKVLEKKRAEKDAKMMTSGEDKLYSNYSIVDQIKKAGSNAANLARQQTERASMMDFARTSEALNAPKVPPTIQGLQPKVASSGSETNVLSAIVQSLAQKQQKQLQSGTQSSSGLKELGSRVEEPAANADAGKCKQSTEVTKTLGTIVAPTLSSTKTSQENKLQSNIQTTPKLPVSTSIKPILKDGKQSPKAVETGGAIGQQMLNFYKNSFSKTNSLSDAAKSAETLTKNIPAGTTVTVKTVDNKPNGKSSPSPSTPSPAPTPPAVASPKSSAFVTNFSTTKTLSNPFSSISAPISQPPLINPLLHSSLRDSMNMALAAQQAQYLNFNNPGFGAAAALAAAQMEAANYVQAANIMRAAQAAQAAAHISQPPVTTLEFTKPSQAQDQGRFGLKIPTPTLNRNHNPTVSSFGTSKLQVKVNSDTPREDSPKITSIINKSVSSSPPVSTDSNGMPSVSSNGKAAGTHCMPAILPFHSVKKVQALPKSTGYSPRPTPVSTMLKTHTTSNSKPSSPSVGSPIQSKSTNSVQSLTDSNPFKSSFPVKQNSSLESLRKAPTPPTPTSVNNPFKPVTQSQVNSLKKLAAGLTSAHEKVLKGDNILSSLKKNNSEKKLLGDLKGYGLENKSGDGGKEVTSS